MTSKTVLTSATLLTTPRFRVEEVTHQLAQGGTKTRAIVRHCGAVAVIPMVDANHVCLINNYRVSVDQTLLEIPAGTRETAEAPLVTARRELIEETGYHAKTLEEIVWFYLSPGILDERMHIFLATGLTPGAAAREAGEEIENRVTPWDEAISLIFEGRITDAKTIAALLFYDRVRQHHADCHGR